MLGISNELWENELYGLAQGIGGLAQRIGHLAFMSPPEK
jgi:hypothetical protein